MSALKNRRTAALIMAAMMVLALPLGAGASGRRMFNKVEAAFEQNVAGDLMARVGAASALNVVAWRYLSADDPQLQKLAEAASTASDAETLQEAAQADRALEEAFLAVYLALDEDNMSEKDAGYRSGLYAEFLSAAQKIAHDSYNDTARAYNKNLKAFPGRMFFTLLGYDPAPVWE